MLLIYWGGILMPLAVQLNEREQLIVDLMQALIVEKVNFKVVYRKFQEHIERLRLVDGETAWRPERLELVVFPEWFVGKVLNLGYGVFF